MIKPNVFISYSQKDSYRVSIFSSFLVQSGYDVWMDVKNIPLGGSIFSAIVDGLSKADIYIIFISHNSINSKWVVEELNLAITKSIQCDKPRIIPILLDDCDLPALLTGRLYLDAKFSIGEALKQFNDKFILENSSDGSIQIPTKPICSSVIFGLSKDTNISIGGLIDKFEIEDLVMDRENIQRELRKKANGILLNFVPLSDFDLQSPIPKYKNGMYAETVERIPGPFDSSICERLIVQVTVYCPDTKKLDDIIHNKLDKLRVTSLTFVYTVPLQSDGFDKKCIKKMQDNYSIISYDYEDGATIEYNEDFYISVKCTSEQVFIKLYTKYDFLFSKTATKFSVENFIEWIIK